MTLPEDYSTEYLTAELERRTGGQVILTTEGTAA